MTPHVSIGLPGLFRQDAQWNVSARDALQGQQLTFTCAASQVDRELVGRPPLTMLERRVGQSTLPGAAKIVAVAFSGRSAVCAVHCSAVSPTAEGRKPRGLRLRFALIGTSIAAFRCQEKKHKGRKATRPYRVRCASKPARPLNFTKRQLSELKAIQGGFSLTGQSGPASWTAVALVLRSLRPRWILYCPIKLWRSIAE